MCLHKNTLRKEHERRRVAGKTVEETRCARRRLVVVVVFLLSLSPLLLFFVVAKRAKERPLMTLFFSLFFSSSQPTTQKRTSRVISLSLYLWSRRKFASTGASLRCGFLPGNCRRRHRTVPRERLARGDRLRAEKFGRETERRAQLRDVVAFVILKKGDT